MAVRRVAYTIAGSWRASRNFGPSAIGKMQYQSLHNGSGLSRRIPKGTWDTHMHVVEPGRYPLSKAAQYQPSAHTLDQAEDFLGRLGIQKMVIVQPSIYGNDNSCTLDGLRRLGPKRGRAVIQFDPKTTPKETLREWHDLGVRGVRLNFKSAGTRPTAGEVEETMRQYGGAVRSLGWVLEVYIALEDMALLEQAVRRVTGVKICIDHFGHPQDLSAGKKASDLPGFQSLMSLLDQGDTWVKISASYRLSKDPNDPVVESLCKAIVRRRPDRCVFATDWPHTRFEFDGLDVSEYLRKILDWCEEEGVSLQQVLVDNAEELFT